MGRVIRNFDQLAESELRADALAIAEAGYGAVSTRNAIERKMRVEGDSFRIDGHTLNLAGRRLFFIGVGKCAFAAAEVLESVVVERITDGIALGVSRGDTELLKLRVIRPFAGTHPLPSNANVQATRNIVELLESCTENDLVLMLISGGGSTLLCLHDAPMTCLDESVLFKELTAKGATIQEINTVRKHTSRARGGGLAKAAYPAEIISLIVSDVPGDDVGFVASGPTVFDTSTVADAIAVLARHGVPAAPHIGLTETPKEQKYFERVTNVLFITSWDALSAMEKEAGVRGYAATIADTRFTGEAADLGRAIAKKLHDAPAKTALLYAGESTITLSAGARAGLPAQAGGRSQEVALAALADVRLDELVLPFASDGHDNTEHAGAIADMLTRERANARGLSIEEHLSRHGTYEFFSATGDALSTGYTDSNVSDLIIALKQ